MHRPGAPEDEPREPGGEDHEVPSTGIGGGWRDDAFGAELGRAPSECLRGVARAGEVVQLDPEHRPDVRASKVQDGQAVHVDRPEAPPLVGRVDGAVGGGGPLGPDGPRLERCVERPGITGAVVAALPDGRAIRWVGGRVDPRLAVDAAAERGDERERQT